MKSYTIVLFAFLLSLGMQAQELVTGKATLTRIKSGVYEVKKEDGTVKQLDIRPNVEEHLQGTLAVLFKECETLRQSVFDLKLITEDDLVQTVKTYNNCDYTAFEPTEREVKQAANYQDDQYKLFGSVGASLNRISFFNFDDYENMAQGQLSFGIAASPGFIGSLQGNLYVTLELSAALSGDKDFGNAPFETNIKKDSERAQLGLEYQFNKNGSVQPLVGVGIGLASDHYDGSYNGYKLDEREGSGFWIPKAGVLFSLDNKKSLGVIVSYIPEYENDLTFINDGELIPLIIDTHYINAALYIYF